MIGVNRYFRHSKISEARFRYLVRCFALDLTATQTAAVTGISVRSVNAIFLRMRRRMAPGATKVQTIAQLQSAFQTAAYVGLGNPQPGEKRPVLSFQDARSFPGYDEMTGSH